MKYMDYKGYKISKLSLGTVQFGLDYGVANKMGKPTQSDVNKIINFVCENGINCFDTAQAYGNSEEVLGNALSNIADSLVVSKLSSKLFVDNIKGNVEISLKNLKLDSIFGLLLHDSELLYKWNDKYKKKVSELIEDKLIKHFGVSIYSSKDFNLAVENDDISIIQIPFNMFDLRAINENWFEKAKEKGKLIFIRSVFLQGLLLMNKDNLPEKLFNAKKYLGEVEKLSMKFKMDKSELVLSFVDSVAKDSVLLFGCDNLTQAKVNLENYKKLKTLSRNQIDEIIKIFKDISEDIYLPTRW